MLRCIAAGMVGFLAFALPYVLPDFAAGLPVGIALRGVLAGLAAALTLERDDVVWAGPAMAVVASTAASLWFVMSPGVAWVPRGYYVLGVVAALCAATAVGLAMRAGFARVARVVSVLAVCGAFLWSIGYLPGPFVPVHQNQMTVAVPSADLAPEAYGFDGLLFMRTAQLVRSGSPYYPAFLEATREDARFSAQQGLGSVFNYREPFMFYVWAALPGIGGGRYYVAFVVFALLVGTGAYRLASRFVRAGPALIGMIAVLAYLEAFALAVDTWFMFMEIWAGGFFVLCVWAFSRRRLMLSALLLLAAVATREFMILLVPVWVAAWWLGPRRYGEWPALLVATAAPVAALTFHFVRASAFVTPGAGAGDVSRWLQASWENWYQALEFGLTDSVLTPKLIYLALVAAILGAALTRLWWQRVLLVGAVGVPAILLRAISGGDQWSYWGFIAVPVILGVAPVLATRYLPSREALRDPERALPKPPKVRFVIPIGGALTHLDSMIGRVDSVMKRVGLAYAVLVVDESSADDAASVVNASGKSYPVALAKRSPTEGPGRALVRGLTAATRASRPGDVVLTFDGSAPASDSCIEAMLERASRGADVVVASRFSQGATRAESRGRDSLSRLACLALGLVSPAEGVRDYTSTVRLYSFQAACEAFLGGAAHVGWTTALGSVSFEIIGRLKGVARFDEVPLVVETTPATWPHGRLRDFVCALGHVLRARYLSPETLASSGDNRG
jgi:hypothetical protein